jgi:hypothetical protein
LVDVAHYLSLDCSVSAFGDVKAIGALLDLLAHYNIIEK